MTTSVNEFFDAWSVYAEILARNYMHHDDIYRSVRAFIAERFNQLPINVLDLGCGSALHLAQALSVCAVRGYVGYDLSDAALAQARGNLAGLGCAVRLHRAELLAGLRSQGETFDLIVTSFALHHLTSADKAAFFQLTAERLSKHGLLLVIDTFRARGESRDRYLDRYCDWLGTRCKTLGEQALTGLFDHIRNYDFPETAKDLTRMARDARFNSVTKVNQVRWHQSWSFERVERLI